MSSYKSTANLSVGFIESAFRMLIWRCLPTYRQNINHPRPPVAGPENANAAAAIVMFMTALDYHLCRLKYLRDVAKHNPSSFDSPYFNWAFDFDEPLGKKLETFLMHRKERSLLKRLIELTVCRDTVVHPKFYTITYAMNQDLSYKKIKAELAPGVTLREKTKRHKLKRQEFTRLLRLPVVPTWISYVDAVICILVLHRLLNLLEARCGNPYAWVGTMTAYEKETKELFVGWNWKQNHPNKMENWVEAFYNSLSTEDQEKVKRALGNNWSVYLKPQHSPFKLT